MIKKILKIETREEFNELAAFTVFFYIIPIYLLTVGVIPFEYRHIIMFTMGLILVAWAIQRGISSHELGLRRDNLKKSLIANGIASVAMIVAIFVGIRFGLIRPVDYSGTVWWLFVYILISVPLQEFIFRSLIFREIGVYSQSKTVKVVLSSVLFAFIHSMYSPQVVIMTAIAGLVWGFLYLKWPNFWGVTLSHATVGVVAIFVGLV